MLIISFRCNRVPVSFGLAALSGAYQSGAAALTAVMVSQSNPKLLAFPQLQGKRLARQISQGDTPPEDDRIAVAVPKH